MRDDHAAAVELSEMDLDGVAGGLAKRKQAQAAPATPGRAVHAAQAAGRPVASGTLTAAVVAAAPVSRRVTTPARQPDPVEEGGCPGGICPA